MLLEEAEIIVSDGEGDIETRDSGSLDESSDIDDDTLNLANSYLPSAMGISCFLDIPKEGFRITITAGRYKIGDVAVPDKDGNPITKRGYLREPLDTEISIPRSVLPTQKKRSCNFDIQKDNKSIDLILNITNRTPTTQFDETRQLYTFSLINNLKSSNSRVDTDDCFFQVGFTVRAQEATPCFLPYPSSKSTSQNEDERSVRLLYRHHHTFAIGHGCAPSWGIEPGEQRASEIQAEILPTFEIQPILPTKFDDITLKMYDMSDYGESDSLTSNLSALCQKYEAWITEQETAIASEILSEELHQTAERHIQQCKTCLNRMRRGIALLKTDQKVRKAFQLMNRAMLMQQLRYGIKLREWNVNEDQSLSLTPIEYPDIHHPDTWPKKLGSWRPFQIAFILMNLQSMISPDDEERKLVDLIWFPTGGGKTEAYLGLTAFTIFLKRLCDSFDSGTTVLMRYTLRLLNAQQYQQAASLICACELIRKEHEHELGTERITIGLWVGQSLSSNRRDEAVRVLKKMGQGDTKENPFIMLKCPWCGAKMGPVHVKGNHCRVQGYQTSRKPSTVIFQCHNEECKFSDKSFNLPLLVIDEDIYESPPTLVIGTVDKFAMLPWKSEARSLFGFRQDENLSPPELIIQDELHLISGPLGSMVGHYETLISELCVNRTVQPHIRPKIVASTATISRAREQGHALYNCGRENVFQFPPQCINAGESFFAYEDKDAKGRIYVGVHATGYSSHATTQVRVISALLQGCKSATVNAEEERDPYWTIVNYFNSLRELGHAATLVSADIREYLNAVWIRSHIHKTDEGDPRRFINHAIELTSRVSSGEIPDTLQALEVSYPRTEKQYPVDICLATNMISVGVDVPRLGLMTVIGQPKTTSEYIQATSRVGRSQEGPGLVVVIYNPGKPRDRSHYEHFWSYHSTIYSQVEPTSVTPFSAPVRERALHALLVGFIRYWSKNNRTSPTPLPQHELTQEIFRIFEQRVKAIDPDEANLTMNLLKERLDEWERYSPAKYGDFSKPTEELPLMYPAGTSPHDEWNKKAWSTPTSMRNVDVTCEAVVVSRYECSDDIEED
ncbi:hypothetical protein U27_02973 [Candidatus Vecturithrix granuli]|uniref:Helicase C-terminal domain-containing protein n=1 Tax=Vecturithrix granuli TaxID=1499967 RepID=A0A081BUK7_VECG1|nr:hypothetical protein U27_02973 [Candidatus Vecturithrix granuli]